MSGIKMSWKRLYTRILGKVLESLPDDTNYRVNSDGAIVTLYSKASAMEKNAKFAEGERGPFFALP